MRANVCLISLLLFAAALVHAQTYSIDWFTIDGGGGTSTGGVYSVSSTIGQPDAGVPGGDPYLVLGGFWGLQFEPALIGGFEADVAPRPDGNNDGTVTVADWVQVGRFAAGLDAPTPGAEFQKADCAPLTTLGDGFLSVADWVQAGRYAAGLDSIRSPGGPSR